MHKQERMNSSKQEQLDKIKSEILNNMKCPLKDSATNLVFGKGNPDAQIVLIGEAPGKNEDLQGVPFVGAAGKQLDSLLHLIDLGIDDVYIANILKYRPPENRNPSVDEIKRHTPYLIKQIEIIKPQIIITLGNFATKFVLSGFNVEGMNKVKGITSLHGDPQSIIAKGSHFIVVPMFHPAAVLYNRSLEESIKEDFIKLKKLL